MVETTVISNSFLQMDTIRGILDPKGAWDFKSYWDEIVGPKEYPNHLGKVAKECHTCSHTLYCSLLSTPWRNAPIVKIYKNVQIQILLGNSEKGKSKNYL